MLSCGEKLACVTEAALAPTGLHVRAEVNNLFFSHTHNDNVQSGDELCAAKYFESGENEIEINSEAVNSQFDKTFRFFAPSCIKS